MGGCRERYFWEGQGAGLDSASPGPQTAVPASPGSPQSSTDLFIHLFHVYLMITHESGLWGPWELTHTTGTGSGSPLPPPHSANQRCIHCRSHTRCTLSHSLAHTHPPPHSHTDGGDGLGPGRKYPINVYPVTHGPSQEPAVS